MYMAPTEYKSAIQYNIQFGSWECMPIHISLVLSGEMQRKMKHTFYAQCTFFISLTVLEIVTHTRCYEYNV
jgi:hypothetical protein